MSTLTIVLVVLLILLLFGGIAGRGSYGSNAYYGPGLGLVRLVVLLLLVLVLTGTLKV